MTFRRIVNWLVGLPIAVIAIGFAVANRQWVTISFDPFNRALPFATIDMPLWALFFCGAFVGLLAGWMMAWAAHGKHRKAARQARIELIRAQQMHERYKQDHERNALAVRQDAVL